jgi:hypothetical protein
LTFASGSKLKEIKSFAFARCSSLKSINNRLIWHVIYSDLPLKGHLEFITDSQFWQYSLLASETATALRFTGSDQQSVIISKITLRNTPLGTAFPGSQKVAMIAGGNSPISAHES